MTSPNDWDAYLEMLAEDEPEELNELDEPPPVKRRYKSYKKGRKNEKAANTA